MRFHQIFYQEWRHYRGKQDMNACTQTCHIMCKVCTATISTCVYSLVVSQSQIQAQFCVGLTEIEPGAHCMYTG